MSSCTSDLGSSTTKHVVLPEYDLSTLPQSTYVCELCGLSVRTKANLRVHQVKTHKILKNDLDVAFFRKQKNRTVYVYHCPIKLCKHHAAGGFTSASRLKQHFQTVHMQKLYQCDKCDQRFPTPSAQKYHTRLCGTTYSCTVCHRSYTHKKHLYQHHRRMGHGKLPSDCSSGSLSLNYPQFPLPQTDLGSFNLLTCIIPQLEEGNNGGVMLSLPVLLPQTEGTRLPVLGRIAICLDSYAANLSKCDDNRIAEPTLASSLNFSQNLPVLQPAVISSVSPKLEQPGVYDTVIKTNSVGCETCPLINCGTQTDEELFDLVTSGLPSATPQVSVNTWTDDDDISAFLGSLFCDAGVGTVSHDASSTDVDMEYKINDTQPIVDCATPPIDCSVIIEDLEHLSNFINTEMNDSDPLHAPDHTFDSCFNDACLITAFESVAMQTDQITKLHVAAATNRPSMDRQTYCTPSRLLQTPSPIPTGNLNYPSTSCTSSASPPMQASVCVGPTDISLIADTFSRSATDNLGSQNMRRESSSLNLVSSGTSHNWTDVFGALSS